MLAATPLEQLIAAVLVNAPGAQISERGAHAATIAYDVTLFLLIEANDPVEFEAAIRSIRSNKEVVAKLCIVAIDSADIGAEKILDRVLPRSLMNLRWPAHVWKPGKGLSKVRGARWALLSKAVDQIESGAIASAGDVIGERSTQADEVAAFMGPLMARTPYVTYAIAALSVVLFGLQYWWGDGSPYASAPRMGGAMKSLIYEGEVWRLVAPMLLHGSIIHLGLNMMGLFSFGLFLERFLGPRRYLILYVASGIGGGIASALRPDEVISVGASGGIWGLMVAGAVLVTWPRSLLPTLVTASQRQRAWAPVGINALYSFQPGIDLLAHFGGGLIGGLLMFTGAVTAGLPSVQEAIAAPNARRDGFLIRFTAGVLGLALLGGVGVALFTGRPWELSSEPALHRVDVDGHWSIELPTLVGAPTGDGKSRLFGSIQYDGIGFQIEDLGEMQGDDLRETFREMLEQPNTPWPNFHFTVEPEIREHEGRSYVFAEQATDDARVAQTYTLADGRHLVSVLVVPLRVSEPWRAVATRVPFTVKWHD